MEPALRPRIFACAIGGYILAASVAALSDFDPGRTFIRHIGPHSVIAMIFERTFWNMEGQPLAAWVRRS